jgi:hypothetical protein
MKTPLAEHSYPLLAQTASQDLLLPYCVPGMCKYSQPTWNSDPLKTGNLRTKSPWDIQGPKVGAKTPDKQPPLKGGRCPERIPRLKEQGEGREERFW